MLYLGLLVVSRSMDLKMVAWWGSPIHLDLTFSLLFNPMPLEI